MNNVWQIVPIKSAALPVERPERPIPGTVYRQLGVRLWGVGAYEREPLEGSQTKYATLSRVETGDIVVNKIWARNGSVAVVPDVLAGCYVSGEFPTFAPRPELLDPRWFHWITKTKGFWEQCDEKSRGTSGKNRIRSERFLQIMIPLPPLAEQQRIVGRIEELAGKVEEAWGLRRAAAVETGILWDISLTERFRAAIGEICSLESVCQAIIDNLHSTPTYDGDKYPCIRSQDIGWGTIDYSRAFRTSEAEFKYRTQRGEPKPGDILYVREGDIGRCAIVDGSQRFSLGQRVMLLRPDRHVIDPRFLLYQLLSSAVLHDQVRAGKTGTTSHHINIANLRRVSVAVPLLHEQHRIVAYLDDLQVKVNELKKLQAETAAELNAMLPSVLDWAFKGEL